jgi:hypothetical protein
MTNESHATELTSEIDAVTNYHVVHRLPAAGQGRFRGQTTAI